MIAIRKIIETTQNLRYLVIIVAAALMIIGVGLLRVMPVDVLPEFSPPFVEIQTEALGLSAEEVEALITVPLEADLLNGVAWLESINSESITGLSSIILTFEPGTDVLRARQMVQERLTQAHALPNVSKPPTMLQPLSSTNRVMMVGVSSEELSLIDLSVLARWNIKPRLMGVQGVANVAIWGQRKRQLQVQVDPATLRDQGVTLQQVINTSGNALWFSPLTFLNASYPGTGGWIDTPNQRLGVRHLLPITTAEDLAKVTVEGKEGMVLGDVAEVVENHQPLIGDAIINEQPGLLLVIEKFPGAHTLEVTRGVEEALDLLEPGLAGVEFNRMLYRPASFIEAATGNLTLGFVLAAVLVALVLFAFAADLRSGLISVVAIPLSLTAALLVLYLSGATLNMMLLAGLLIALAVVIDDAVVDVDTIRRRLREHRAAGGEVSAARVVVEATFENRRIVIYATLIGLLAIVPVFAVGGLAGALLQPLAASYALAVVASLVVALTVTPALSLAFFGREVANGGGAAEGGLAGWLRRSYSGLSGLITRPLPVFTLFVSLLVAAALLLPGLRVGTLMPTFKEPYLLYRWTSPPATTQMALRQTAELASRELRGLDGVTQVTAHIGRAVTSDQVVDVNSGNLWIGIDPGADYDATVAEVGEVLAGYPGLGTGGTLTTYLAELTEGRRIANADTLTVRVYGNDYDVLAEKGQEVAGALAGIDGVDDARVIPLVEKPTLEVEVDLAAAEAHGLKPGDVRRAASALLSGIEVGNLFEDQKVFDVVVWGVPETRSSVTTIENLLIDTPSGEHVRLNEVANVAIIPTPDTISRQGVSRYLDVEAAVSGRNLRAVASDVEPALAGIDFPIEYHTELLGDYQEWLAARRNVLSLAVAALLGVFLLLQAAFRSWRLAGVGLAALAASLTGGVIVATLAGGELTLGSLLAFVGILALAARQIVLQVHRYEELERREGMPFGRELVLRGTQDRVLPTVTTVVATALAVVPLLLFGGRAGFEVLAPLAIVLLGGLVTTVIASLLILPALRLRFTARPEPEFDFTPSPDWLTGGTADAMD